MHHLVRSLAMMALAPCGSVAPASAQVDRAPGGKLRRGAVPLAYRLAFKANPAQQTFSGTTTIKVQLKQVCGHLWLDGLTSTSTRSPSWTPPARPMTANTSLWR